LHVTYFVGVWSCEQFTYYIFRSVRVARECCIFGVSESRWCETAIVSEECALESLLLTFDHTAHFFFVCYFIAEHVRRFYSFGGSWVAADLFFRWFLDSCRFSLCGVYNNSCLLEMKFAMELYSCCYNLKSGGGGSQVPLSFVSCGLFDKPIDQPGSVPLWDSCHGACTKQQWPVLLASRLTGRRRLVKC
jgi:hypothetical protein